MSEPLRVWAGEPLVIDSSVAFDWFDVAGSGADEAESLLRAHQRDDVVLVAPSHLPLEVANALVSRHADLEDVERAIGFLRDADLLLVPADHDLLADAVRIAFEERRGLYDAAFIALAARLDAELITADPGQASTNACKVRLIR